MGETGRTESVELINFTSFLFPRSRSIIAGTATFLGLVCGYALYPIARRQFDIAIWSILIEASTEARSSRPLKLSNLDSWIENVALLSALQVLWSRCLGRVKGVRSFCVVTFALTLLLGEFRKDLK